MANAYPHLARKKKQKALQALKRGKTEEAQRLLEQVCRIAPQDADSWFRLGAIHGQQGDLETAYTYAKKAVELDPKLAAAHTVLGNVLASQGRHEEAREHYRKALETSPDDPTFLLNYGTALYLAGEYEGAAEILLRAARRRPRDATLHNNLGNVFKALNDHSRAVHHYQVALQLNPALFEAHLNLGDIFIARIGHPGMAEHHYQSAIEQQPNDIQAMAGLLNTLRFQGRLDEALEQLAEFRRRLPNEPGLEAARADLLERRGDKQAALEQATALIKSGHHLPMAVDVWLRTCHLEEKCDAAIDLAENLLTSDGIRPSEAQMLHFALGNRLDRLQRYEEAFRHYQKGNECIKTTWEPAAFEKEIEAIIDCFERHPPDPNVTEEDGQSPCPIFIVGMPRSGTSLTEQILASHPEVAGAGELNTINDLIGAMQRRFSLSKPYPHGVAELKEPHLCELGRAYCDTLRQFHSGEPYVTDKMPHNFKHLGLIHRILPNARIIHCVRDPRDTCLSIFFQNFGWIHPYSSRLEWLGFYYRQYARLMEHWARISIPMLTIHYEDLVQDQENTIRKLLHHCGLEWNDACLDFHKQRRHVATASYDQVRQKLYTGSIARWRHYEHHLQPLFDALGDAVDTGSSVPLQEAPPS